MDAGKRTLTVLVVDDDDAVRAVAAKVLRRSGYEVLEAASAPEALRIARARRGRLDLLLTDVMMPGLSGRELSERLRGDFPWIPVLFMSGYTEDEIVLEGAEVANAGFLAKPFDLESLLHSVREVLERGQGGR